jgi:dihydropteroate synthase
MNAASAPLGPGPLTLRGRSLPFGLRTYVMGIINVTPDSFSGDGLLTATTDPTRAAVELARRMRAEGADVLDVGGESTRPGHAPVPIGDERSRVIDVVAAIREALPEMPVSIDTRHAPVAEAALDAGADLVNDVGAVVAPSEMAALVAGRRVPWVLMHDRSEPRYVDVVGEVVAELGVALDRAVAAGCAIGTLIVDPGIGFGKTAEQNLALLRGLAALRGLGRPILLGTSRKSTIGKVLDLPSDQRLEGTLATTALGIAAGADFVRVHDVGPNVRAARMADAIVRGGWRESPHAGG